MTTMAWLFWLLVGVLFVESWSRAWAKHHRGTRARVTPGDNGDESR